MFEALETNPTLRERVLGLTAICAVLVGGAAGVDTMLTGGWQFGADDPNAAPVIYAQAQPQYQDDVSHDWSVSPPQHVQLASQNAAYAIDPAQIRGGLDGASDGTVTPASYAPTRAQAAAPAPSSSPSASDQRFQAIENDIRQATAAADSSATKDDTATPSESDHG